MKPKQLAFFLALLSCSIAFTSCKKTNTENGKEDLAVTLEFATDQAISDNLTEDANNLFMEAATENKLVGQKPESPAESLGVLGCATVTITPLAGFPKNIAIDFGNGCTSGSGIIRKGKINIILSDSVRKTGSTVVLTFDNYFVNNYKKEGVITWTNNSTATVKGWNRTIENGKITAPTGRYWLHNGVKEVVQVAGYATPLNLLDDVFSVTGNHTIVNAAGVSRTSVIIDPLEKKTICENITKGNFKMQGPAHNAVIDFGNGDCDKIATISIDGNAPVTFLLR